jgi:endoglucanase
VWGQVAERFKDYDHKLILESINEPRLVGTNVEWWFNTEDERILDAADCLNRLNQAFVETVRATGGNNADRYLMMPG